MQPDAEDEFEIILPGRQFRWMTPLLEPRGPAVALSRIWAEPITVPLQLL